MTQSPLPRGRTTAGAGGHLWGCTFWGCVGHYKGGFAFPHRTRVGKAEPAPSARTQRSPWYSFFLTQDPLGEVEGGVARHPSFDAQPW